MKKIELILNTANNYFMHEAFNTLRTNLLFCGAGIKSIVVTSCVANEGKTTVAAELAKSLSEANKKTLFIDADLRKSVTVSRFTHERRILGLSHFLSEQNPLDDCIYATQYPNLDVLFAGPCPPNPADQLGGETFRLLLEGARQEYDYIIVDAPPLGLVVDAALIAAVTDASVIVLNQGKIRYGMAQDIKRQLEAVGSKILGVILNQASGTRNDSFYKEGYQGRQYNGKLRSRQNEKDDDDWEPIEPNKEDNEE